MLQAEPPAWTLMEAATAQLLSKTTVQGLVARTEARGEEAPLKRMLGRSCGRGFCAAAVTGSALDLGSCRTPVLPSVGV